MICPSCAIALSLRFAEGAGKAGRRLRPQRRVQKAGNNAHGFDRYSRDIPAFPAQWFYGLYGLSPVSGLCCHRYLAATGRQGSTPGSRRQDHTTSPYAAAFSSGGQSDPPDAAASIATRATLA